MRFTVLLLSLACFACSASLPRKGYEGRWDEVRAEIEKGADPDALLETSGDSILFFAAEQGNIEMVRFLLAKGAKPDVMSPSGETPLYAAADACQPDIVKLLMAHGADPRRPTSFHGTVMHVAARNCTELIGFFASRGLSVNMENAQSNELTPLMAAASTGNVDGARELLRLGADIHRLNRDRQNVFDYIFHLKNSKVLILLLDYGAKPQAGEISHVLSFWGVDSFENIQVLLRRRLITPAQALHAVTAAAPFLRGNAIEGVALESREEIIQKLLQTGVSIHLRDSGGRTVLMTALHTGPSIDFLRFLVKHGASAAGLDQKGSSALSMAVNSQEESMLSTGADSAEQILAFIAAESAKQTPRLSRSERVLLALAEKDDASVKAVVNAGYRFETREEAQIALVYAAANRGPEILLALFDAGAHPNRPAPEPGMLCCMRPTALIAAAKYGRAANVRLLLAKGANPDERFGCCGGGIGPLDAAKDVEIRRILEKARK